MTNKVPLSLDQAKQLGLKSVKNISKPEGGIDFDARKDGDICYISPCMNGQRYIYYWFGNECSLGFIQPC